MTAETVMPRRKQMVLTDIEKLDGKHLGLAFAVKTWFAQGVICEDIPALLLEKFGVTVSAAAVKCYRIKRWVPEQEFLAMRIATTKAAIEAFGGDTGLDAVLLAKLWELMDQMTIAQMIAARTLFIKVRAQNLKEQEFLYKTGQWKPPHEGGDAPDPETQQRNVLRRIKEIFGLAGHDDEEEPATPQLPAAEVEVCEPEK